MSTDVTHAQSISAANIPRDSVYQLAEQVAEALGYYEDKDILKAVKKAGGRVEVRDFWRDDKHTGSLIIKKKGEFTIFIPNHTSLERDKFTIAHEFGHYIIHYLVVRLDESPNSTPFQANRYGTGREEWEANWFAAAFLMPEAAFRRAYSDCNGLLSKLAADFGVSVSAAQVRARALGLVQ